MAPIRELCVSGRHELLPGYERENMFGGRGERRLPGHPVSMAQLTVGRGPSGVGTISLGPDGVPQELMHGAGVVFFRVPSRAALGYGGTRDSPPVYALIGHRKKSRNGSVRLRAAAVACGCRRGAVLETASPLRAGLRRRAQQPASLPADQPGLPATSAAVPRYAP